MQSPKMIFLSILMVCDILSLNAMQLEKSLLELQRSLKELGRQLNALPPKRNNSMPSGSESGSTAGTRPIMNGIYQIDDELVKIINDNKDVIEKNLPHSVIEKNAPNNYLSKVKDLLEFFSGVTEGFRRFYDEINYLQTIIDTNDLTQEENKKILKNEIAKLKKKSEEFTEPLSEDEIKAIHKFVDYMPVNLKKNLSVLIISLSRIFSQVCLDIMQLDKKMLTLTDYNMGATYQEWQNFIKKRLIDDTYAPYIYDSVSKGWQDSPVSGFNKIILGGIASKLNIPRDQIAFNKKSNNDIVLFPLDINKLLK